MSTVATVMESVWKFEGVINMTGAASIAFYYLYLNTQQFKRDPLTNALNRRCFYLDAEKNFAQLNAVISLDLNNLKQLNDGKGHAEGDKAICTMADCIRKVILKNCYLYRTGGDEFMILAFKQPEDAVRQMIESIKEEMAKTEYRCAIGMAYMDMEHNFEKLCMDADEAMYRDKEEGKKKESQRLFLNNGQRG
ncbi:MAG: GGDEF domain-containing protein [Thermoflexaceae bacterium]|nr:GGDEF domain-containing protein [Thermoflexaceae bacterium]